MGWDKDAEAVGKALLLISRRRSGETLLFRGLPSSSAESRGWSGLSLELLPHHDSPHTLPLEFGQD